MRRNSRTLARFAAAGVLGLGLIGSLTGAAEASPDRGPATTPGEAALPAGVVVTHDCPDPGDLPLLPALPAAAGPAARDDVPGGHGGIGPTSVEVRDGKVYIDGEEVAALPAPVDGTRPAMAVAVKDGKVYVGEEAEAVAGIPALPARPGGAAVRVAAGGKPGDGDGPDHVCVTLPGTAVPAKPAP